MILDRWTKCAYSLFFIVSLFSFYFAGKTLYGNFIFGINISFGKETINQLNHNLDLNLLPKVLFVIWIFIWIEIVSNVVNYSFLLKDIMFLYLS